MEAAEGMAAVAVDPAANGIQKCELSFYPSSLLAKFES